MTNRIDLLSACLMLAAGVAVAPVLAQGIEPLPVVENAPIDTGICTSTRTGDYRGTDAVITCTCPADQPAGLVWGSDTYTDDSAICTAARHRGVIGIGGGRVTLQTLPGQAEYRAVARNGVESGSYGSWSGSYRFVAVGGDGAAALAAHTGITDAGVCDTAAGWRGRTGMLTCLCPASSESVRGTWEVWGTDIYTDDSYICKAAVHAGAIDAKGGKVIVELIAGQASYRASTRNGVSSSSYGSWGGSYRFVK